MTIQEKAEALLVEANCCCSVLCRGLDDAEPLISVNPDAVFSSASVIKVPILMALISSCGRGPLRMDQTVDVTHILDDTQAFEGGPRKASLRELAVWMTVISDNTSANALIDMLGFQQINDFTASLGLRQTKLRRKMLDFASREAGIDNVTSARDMFALFMFMFGEGGREFSEAVEILRRQRSHNMLTRYIWEDVAFAHKTGGLDYLSHDAGVFTIKDKNVFAGVFLWDTPDKKGDGRLIGRIGRMVYDYYAYGG